MLKKIAIDNCNLKCRKNQIVYNTRISILYDYMLLNYSIQSSPKDVGVKMNGTKKRNQKL